MAPYHPIIVHFAIALTMAGVVFRLLSLPRGRFAFANAAAAALLLAGSVAVLLATLSGDAAHSPVERVPGSAPAVKEHEESGEWARNIMIAVGVVEILALVFARRGRARPFQFASAVLCVVGAAVVVRTAQLGGDLVYSYAGGVGIRTGDPQDVRRLTLAAAHHQAELDRKEGRPQDAASIVAEAARRFPNDPGVQMMHADSLLRDRGDAAAAQALMQQVKLPEGDARLKRRYDRVMEGIRQKLASPEPAPSPSAAP
jgi:uncharacterized membrane protein